MKVLIVHQTKHGTFEHSQIVVSGEKIVIKNQDCFPPDISLIDATLKNFPINLEFDQSAYITKGRSLHQTLIMLVTPSWFVKRKKRERDIS